MACDNCLDNEFYQDKAEHFLIDYGIPINVSKQILKVLYNSLNDCNINCCNNIFKFPLYTTTQRNDIEDLVPGVAIYNTTTNKLEVYDGTTWQQAW
jgi:hypothetical protein